MRIADPSAMEVDQSGQPPRYTFVTLTPPALGTLSESMAAVLRAKASDLVRPQLGLDRKDRHRGDSYVACRERAGNPWNPPVWRDSPPESKGFFI